MPKHQADESDAAEVERFLHDRGLRHLHVRHRADLITIESGPRKDPWPRARLRRVGAHIWQLEMATHTGRRSEEHTSELQSQSNLVCRLLLEKKKKIATRTWQGRSSRAVY